MSKMSADQWNGVAGSSSLLPTARLLWEACRHDPRPAEIRDLFSLGVDPSVATSAAIEHRIAALLWRALVAADATALLSESQAALEAVHNTYRMEALLLLPRAVSLAVVPLTDIGLEPMILKGPAVAARYPEPGLRPMEDIDLFLPHPQHARAVSALVDAGWAVARRPERDDYDTVLAHRDVPSLLLELHHGLEHPSQRVTTLDGSSLWQMRQPIDCLGTPAFGLPLSEELVFLSAHAGKPHHAFVRLVWIADLAVLINSGTSGSVQVDWDRVRSIAEAGTCLTLVSAALALARNVGVDSPPELFPLPTGGWRGSAIRQLTNVSWPLTHLELPGYHLNYALADTVGRRVRILLVLRGSGHGIGHRLGRMLDAPGLLARRVHRLWRRASLPSSPD